MELNGIRQLDPDSSCRLANLTFAENLWAMGPCALCESVFNCMHALAIQISFLIFVYRPAPRWQTALETSTWIDRQQRKKIRCSN